MTRASDHCGVLDTFLEGRLHGEALTGFEAHLAGCEPCRQQVEGWRTAKREYARWVTTAEDTLPEEAGRTEAAAFVASVATRLENEKVRTLPVPGKPSRATRYAAAAAVAAIAVMGIVRGVDWHTTTETDVPLARSTPPQPTVIPLKRIKDGIRTKAALKAAIGDRIEAPGDGRLLASVLDDRVGLDASGVLDITKADRGTTALRLYKGVVACAVAPRKQGDKFQVTAGAVLVEVVGTRFSVAMAEGSVVTVSVAEGTVRVSSGDERRTVASGESLSVERGALSAVEQVSEQEMVALARLLSEDYVEGDDGKPDVAGTEPQDTRVLPGAGQSGHRKTTAPVNNDKQWRQLIIQGDVNEANRQIAAYLKGAPEDTAARMLLATCQRKMGQYKEAVASYRRVSASADSRVANRARYLAGEISQSKLGDYNGAVSLFDAYLASAPAGAPNRAEAELRLAESLLAVGNNTRARRVLEQIVSEFGRTPIANRARKLLEQTR